MVIGVFNVEIARSCKIEGEVLKEKLREPGAPLDGQPMMTTIENGVAIFGILGAWDSYDNWVNVTVRNLVSRNAAIHVIGIYCGVPQSLECFRVARKVLEEAGEL